MKKMIVFLMCSLIGLSSAFASSVDENHKNKAIEAYFGSEEVNSLTKALLDKGYQILPGEMTVTIINTERGPAGYFLRHVLVIQSLRSGTAYYTSTSIPAVVAINAMGEAAYVAPVTIDRVKE